MGDYMGFTRRDLLSMAMAYHGRVYTTEQFNSFTSHRLWSLSHPLDAGRKPEDIGWK